MSYKTYLAQIQERQIVLDQAQRAAFQRFYLLHLLLQAYEKTRRRKWLRFFIRSKRARPPKGIYLYGDVGRGKSMLMDMFFEHAPLKKKRRVHFHSFMLEVHAKLHALQKADRHQPSTQDPLKVIASNIANECSLLCFDELQVTDIADAMILGRLFQEMMRRNVVIVATSNREPDDLYRDGLQRERFLPFIELLKRRLYVHKLASERDYRMGKAKAITTWYHAPLGIEADVFVEGVCDYFTGEKALVSASLSVQGRTLHLPKTCEKFALCTFEELCAQALGAADYIALCEAMDVVVITDVPVLTREYRNEAKRFVTLIDTLYDHRILTAITAAAIPQELYVEGDGAFEFRRTVSRLMEMQSEQFVREAKAKRGIEVN